MANSTTAMPQRLKKSYPVLTAEILRADWDFAVALLFDLGITCVQEEKRRGGLRLTAQLDSAAPVLLKRLTLRERQLFARSILQNPKIETVTRQGWSDRYQSFLKPFEFLPRHRHLDPIVVDPRGKSSSSNSRRALNIEASLAFGTGTHASTQIAAALLQQAIAEDAPRSVLDVGCGTGILAMIAKHYDVSEVAAVDIDPEALEIAQLNFQRNGMRSIELGAKLPTKKFDLIVANIILNSLRELKGQFLKRLKKSGDLIVSGLLYRDCAPLLAHYPEFRLVDRKNRRGWSAMHLKWEPK